MARWARRFRDGITDDPIGGGDVVQIVDTGEALGHPSTLVLTDGGNGWRFNNSIPDGLYDIYINAVLQDGSGLTIPISPVDIVDTFALLGASLFQRPNTTYASTEPSLAEMLVHLTVLESWAFFTKAGEATYMVTRIGIVGDATDFRLVTLNE